MTYKAVLFDLDGTLINSIGDLCRSTNYALSKHGYPLHEPEAYRYFVGEGALILIRRSLPLEKQNDDDCIQACHKTFIKHYTQHCDELSFVYEGIIEMLDQLNKKELKMAVLSNKPDALTRKCIEKFFPNRKFDTVIGQRDSVPRKPDPAGAFEVVERLGIPSSEFIYLGDTSIDMKTAVTTGMFPVGVLWGFRDRKELQDSGAGAVIERPMDIMGLL